MRSVVGGVCCCRSCKAVFDSEAEFLAHLSVDGFCREGADRIVFEFGRMLIPWRRTRRRREHRR